MIDDAGHMLTSEQPAAFNRALDELSAGAAAMSALDRAVIAGVYEHPTRWAPDKTQFQICAESARGALPDAGLTIARRRRLPHRRRRADRHHDAGRASQPASRASTTGTNIGGSSFVAHVLHAAAAIAAGLCEVALIVYGSTASSDRFAVGTGGLGGGDPPDQFEAPFGPTVLNAYALCAQRHMHEFGTTAEQLAEIAVTTRRHAGAQPGGEVPRADHGRGRARVAHRLVAAAPARLLHHQRRRRRRRRDQRRARPRSARSGRCASSAAPSRSATPALGKRDLTDMAARESGRARWRWPA